MRRCRPLITLVSAVVPALVALTSAVLPLGCKPARATPRPVPESAKPAADAPVPAASAAPEPVPPATLERIRVPGDLPASVVRAPSGAPTTIFLPGICSNASYYLHTFKEAARDQGGVVAIEGDQPCQGEYRTFSWDAARLNARIEAAIAAAGLDAIPPGGLTLVGYSQGAALGEQLAQRWPDRYTRLVLIGAPKDPSTAALSRSRAVVTMSCSRDVTARMKGASERLRRAGVPSTYVEMPGCTHGGLTDGERTFGDAFGFLRDSARPARDDAAPTLLVGAL